VPYIQLVTYRCINAPFTGVKKLKDICKNSGHGVNFRTFFKISGISGQRPALFFGQQTGHIWQCIISQAGKIETPATDTTDTFHADDFMQFITSVMY